MQIYADLGAGIEGATHAIGKQQLERVRRIRIEDKDGTAERKEESQGVDGLLNNIDIDTRGTEEDAAEGLEARLGMEVEEDREDDREREREE